MTPTTPGRKLRFGTAGLLGPEIEEMVREAPEELAEATETVHPADLAEIAEDLSQEDRGVLINNLPADRAGEVIEHLDPGLLKDTLAALDLERAARVLRAMAPDERADAVGSMEREAAEAVLARLPRADREETRRLLAYPRHSAGGLMTPDFLAFPPEEEVAAALDRVRDAAPDVETIYALYVVNGSGRLVGLLSLRDLLTSPGEAPLAEVMRTDFVSANVQTDQEEVAHLISKYDLLALPVVDAENRLLGIVTADDVMDVLVEEATEDVQKMAGVAPIESGYFQSSFWLMARRRAGWLALIFLGQLLTTPALEFFESTIRGTMQLVLFLPLILSTGGNSGSQSATLITRGLALGDVQGSDAGRVALREVLTGLLMGSFLALIGLARAVWVTGQMDIALAVGVAVAAVAMAGATIGGLLPLLIRRLGLDPAVVSSPGVASLMDVTGIVVYFSVARLILSV
jgi:magnesium transporter